MIEMAGLGCLPHETTLLKPPLTTPFRLKLLLPITPIRSVAYAFMLGTTFVETAVYPQAVPYTTCPESNFELGNPVVFHVSLRLRASISLQTWHPVKKDCRQLHRFTAVVSHVLRSIPVFFKVAWAYLCSGGYSVLLDVSPGQRSASCIRKLSRQGSIAHASWRLTRPAKAMFHHHGLSTNSVGFLHDGEVCRHNRVSRVLSRARV